MTSTQAATHNTYKLRELRDTAKRMLGSRYDDQVREYGGILTRLAEARKIDVVDAFALCAEEARPHQIVILAAAQVELDEKRG